MKRIIRQIRLNEEESQMLKALANKKVVTSGQIMRDLITKEFEKLRKDNEREARINLLEKNSTDLKDMLDIEITNLILDLKNLSLVIDREKNEIRRENK